MQPHPLESESILAGGEDAVLQDLQNQGPISTKWKYHHPPVEGIEFDITEAEVATKESTLVSVRLLLTLLCLGDKTNEAAVFRALPESFSAFLSLHPSHDITVPEDSELVSTNLGSPIPKNSGSDPSSLGEVLVPNPVSGSGSSQSTTTGTQKSVLSSIPRLKRLFQEKRKGHSSSGKSINSTVDKQSNSPGCVDASDSIISSTALLIDHGADVRINYAAKMGVREKGNHYFDNPFFASHILQRISVRKSFLIS